MTLFLIVSAWAAEVPRDEASGSLHEAIETQNLNAIGTIPAAGQEIPSECLLKMVAKGRIEVLKLC